MAKTESELLFSQLINISSKTNGLGGFKNEVDYAEFLECFEKLYFQSAKDSFHWQYCPFSVYSGKIEISKIEYLERFPDALEADFIKTELFDIQEYHCSEEPIYKNYGVVNNEGFNFNFAVAHECEAFVFIQKSELPIYTNIELTQNKKIEFLESMIGINPTPKQNEPEFSFRNLLHVDECRKDELIEVLKCDFIPNKNKHNATILATLNKIGIIIIDNHELLYRAIAKDIFSLFKSPTGINAYLSTYLNDKSIEGKQSITEEDVLPFIERYKEFKKPPQNIES
ncbi:MAG: hypothetical protein Q8N05_00140 [Bacteroidota bacterium]|nr:hypothetical protein [Bacteroidota bacterium]